MMPSHITSFPGKYTRKHFAASLFQEDGVSGIQKVVNRFLCYGSQPARRFERLLNRKYRREIAEWDRIAPIVGGMTKLRAFYEQLVVKMGRQFEYHDGYQYQGVDTLSSLVERSDVVICPVDVNSHSACLHVKKCCKQLNKPYYMLRSSSISTLHQTLTEVAAIRN